MVEAGVMAYPVILATMILITRIGQSQVWGELEWLRLGALGLLLGAATAVQVKLTMLGVVHTTAALVTGWSSLVGICVWCGVYLWQQGQLKASRAPIGDALRA